MNREQKRKMGRQGQLGDGSSRRAAAADVAQGRGPRTTPAQFFEQVREEMRQVGWPTRDQTVNYTSIVAGVLVFMTALIFSLSYVFSKFVEFLFQK